MAKKKLDKRIRKKDSCNKKDHRKTADGIRKNASPFVSGVALNVKNLHLHFDVHMKIIVTTDAVVVVTILLWLIWTS